jgi:sulfur relay protein TusB/DsrH
MIVLVKSLPDTPEGKRGIKMARDMAADIVFIQNGIYFALDEMIEGYCGTAYAVKEDVELRGMQNQMRSVKVIDWDRLVDIMAKEDKVIGAF